MKKKRHTVEQIIRILREADGGLRNEEVHRIIGGVEVQGDCFGCFLNRSDRALHLVSYEPLLSENQGFLVPYSLSWPLTEFVKNSNYSDA